jgi:ppGpp synthetase/RelA/SpoT-type nucleotidyltranferase
MADFQVHLESLSDKRKKARKRMLMKQSMKPMHWLLARLKGWHHLHHQNHPRQMALMSLRQHPQQQALTCWQHRL